MEHSERRFAIQGMHMLIEGGPAAPLEEAREQTCLHWP